MLRVGISQRVDPYPGRNETRDALDQRWATLLWTLDIILVPLPNLCPAAPSYFKALELDGFILSGGNDIGEMPERDGLEAEVLKFAGRNGQPVLGVCRGMQFMNSFLGGTLEEVSGHIATSHPISGPLTDTNKYQNVNSYHGQGIRIKGLARTLVMTAQSDDGVVEACAHTSLPWIGIMWHPERNDPVDPRDSTLIRNHFLGTS